MRVAVTWYWMFPSLSSSKNPIPPRRPVRHCPCVSDRPRVRDGILRYFIAGERPARSTSHPDPIAPPYFTAWLCPPKASSSLNPAYSFAPRSAAERCGPTSPSPGSPKNVVSTRPFELVCRLAFAVYHVNLPLPIDPSQPANGKPSGALNDRVSHFGSTAPKKNTLSFIAGPPTSTPASQVSESVAFTVPLAVLTCVHLPSSASGRK